MKIRVEYYKELFIPAGFEIEVEDTATDEEIEEQTKQALYDRLGTAWTIEED